MRGTMRGRRVLLTTAAALACVLATAAAGARPDAPQACPPPPAVDTAAYFNTQGGQEWWHVTRFLADSAVSFGLGVSDTRPVRLCDDPNESCEKTVVLQVRSEERTICVTKESLQGTLRILGVVTARGAGYLERFGLGEDNYDHVVYLLVRNDSVFALYQNLDGKTAFAPQPALGQPGWWFRFDSHADSTRRWPAALWRDTTVKHSARRAGGASHGGAAAAGGFRALPQQTLQYAWMACAAGCCQLHGTSEGGQPEPHPNPHPRPGAPSPRPHPAGRR